MKLSLCLPVMLFSLTIQSQEIGEIVLGIGKIDGAISIDPADYSGVRQFINQGLSQTGLAYAENEDANFLLQTKVDYLYEKDIDINGVPLKVAEIEFSFSIASRNGNLQFGHYSTAIKETGENRKILLRNASRLLKSKQNAFQSFLTAAKAGIMEYYHSHCNEILTTSEQLLALEKFDECMFKLGQVPKEVACFNAANEMMLKAYNAKLNKNCESLTGEIRTLIQQESFSSAYDRIMILPQNAKCKDKLDLMLDEMDHAVCEKYLLAAEAHFARGAFSKCIDVLSGMEKISRNCQSRKKALESKIRARLDASARQQWEFKVKKYNDQLAKDVEKSRTDHDFAMKKLDVDATVKSKELDVSVEMEKYKTQREIEFSKNNAAVDKVRYKELGKTYRAYYKVVGAVIMNAQNQSRY